MYNVMHVHVLRFPLSELTVLEIGLTIEKPAPLAAGAYDEELCCHVRAARGWPRRDVAVRLE
eukprot:SAG22_NODE_15403_length_349_cov_1.036000_2_plen_61_part_01